MLLREYLTEYTKEELLDQARSFEIRKCSGLRKADLIDRIVDNFCTEEMLRRLFLSLEELLYEKDCTDLLHSGVLTYVRNCDRKNTKRLE